MFLPHSATLIKHNMLHFHFFGTLILNFSHKQFPQRLFRTLELCSFCLIAVLHFNPLFNTCFISLCWRNYFFWFCGCYWENRFPFNRCYLVFSFSFFLIAVDIFFCLWCLADTFKCASVWISLYLFCFRVVMLPKSEHSCLLLILEESQTLLLSILPLSLSFYAFFFISPNWCTLDLLVVASMPLKFTLRFF